jgi:HK97 family phage major capsid protein
MTSIEEIRKLYRAAIATTHNKSLPDATRVAAAKEGAELRQQIDEWVVGRLGGVDGPDADAEARARAERIAFPLTSDAPASNSKTLRDRFTQWEQNGRPGTFNCAIYPDLEHDYRAAGNLRANIVYKHEDARPSVEGYGDWRYMAEQRSSRDIERRTAILTTDAATVYSSYLVPSRTLQSLAYHENAQSGILKAGPTIIQTPDDADLYYPLFATDAAATHHDEGVAATETNPVFDRELFKSYRYDGLFSVSNEDLRSSILPMDAILGNAANRALATALATALASGNGSDLPLGLGGATTPTTAGVTSATATTYTMGNLKTLKNSVLPSYRANGAWVFSTDAYDYLDQLVDGEGNYLWQPSNVAGQPPLLLGCPIYEDGGLPAMASGVKGSVLFGDFGQGYGVRYAGPIIFEASEHFLWDRFMTSFRFCRWLDARGLISDAIKHMVQAA